MITVNDLKSFKNNKKITMITAYDYSIARIFDEAGIDTILVGDSLGNTMLGYDNTLAVTVDDMIHHAKAVVRGCKNAFVIVDLPFMSYQTNEYDALVNAGRIIKETNAQAVKLEGGIEVCPQIKKITSAGIPVIAHLGLTPQSFNQMGGYKVQGKDVEAAKKLISDALAVEAAGATMLVLECVPQRLAKMITEKLSIPVIGIGAGTCDGQVLVWQDMFGLGDKQAKFVKKYLNLKEEISNATKEYINDVEKEIFPSTEHTYKMPDEVIEKLY